MVYHKHNLTNKTESKTHTHTRQEWIFEKIRQELSPVTCKLDDHEPNNNEINGKFINVLGEVLGLASCHKRSNHCRYVKGTSPFDITVTSGRLRWHRNQSHTCAPCVIKKGRGQKKEKERSFTSIQMLHTHTPSRSRVNPERQEEEKSGQKRRANDQNSAGGGGEQTDLRNQPTRRNGPDQNRAHA